MYVYRTIKRFQNFSNRTKRSQSFSAYSRVFIVHKALEKVCGQSITPPEMDFVAPAEWSAMPDDAAERTPAWFRAYTAPDMPLDTFEAVALLNDVRRRMPHALWPSRWLLRH